MASRQDLFERTVFNTNVQSDFPRALMIEAWHSDPVIQKKWESCGFIAIGALNQSELVLASEGRAAKVTGTDPDPDSPYGMALAAIAAVAKDGKLPTDAENHAVQHMLQGTFEDSIFSNFLPLP